MADSIAGPCVMRSTTFIVFDTETTGLYPGFDQLVEIAACRFSNGNVIDIFNTLVNPGREIPPKVTEIHGITDEMVKDAPSAEDTVKDFLDYIKEDPLLAHNAPFDERFISFNCHRYNIPAPPNKIYDTLQLAKRLFPELRCHGLGALTNVFQIEHETKHRGLPDVMGTRGVFEQCINRLAAKSITTLSEFENWYGDPIIFSPDKYNLLIKLPEEYKPLQDSVERGDSIEVVYEDRSGKRTRRLIHPQGIYVAYGNLYITAYCHLREANRNFKLERIHAFRVVQESANAECDH